MSARFVEVVAVVNEVRPKRAHRLALLGVGVDRHDDGGLHAEDAGGVRDALSEVPRRGADDAARLFFVRELRDNIQRAPNLERAEGLVVLVLDVHLCPDDPVEPRIVVQRSARDVRPYSLAGLVHVEKRGECRQDDPPEFVCR